MNCEREKGRRQLGAPRDELPEEETHRRTLLSPVVLAVHLRLREHERHAQVPVGAERDRRVGVLARALFVEKVRVSQERVRRGARRERESKRTLSPRALFLPTTYLASLASDRL